MSQPPPTFSTSNNNSQSFSSQPSTTSRNMVVSASPNVNLTRRSHSTEEIPYLTSAALNSPTNAANSINYSITRLNPNDSINYSSNPNISSSYVLSPYHTTNQQNVRTSHGCSICNSSNYCHQCSINSPELGPSNRYIYSNSSECFVQNPQGSFQRISNQQFPLKNVLHTKIETPPNLERIVSSISCPNISLQKMSSKISPVQRTTVATSVANSSVSCHSSPTNMPPPVATASGVPTTTIPLRKVSTFNLPTFSRQSAVYGQNLASISSNQLPCTSSELGRLQIMQWEKASTPTHSNVPSPNIKSESMASFSLSPNSYTPSHNKVPSPSIKMEGMASFSSSLNTYTPTHSNVPSLNIKTEGMTSFSSSSSSLPSPGATAHDHSKISNIKQHRKRRKVNIIPLHKIVSFHQNYLKKCKSKTQIDPSIVKKEK